MAVDGADHELGPALYQAADAGNVMEVSRLLDSGAQIDWKDNQVSIGANHQDFHDGASGSARRPSGQFCDCPCLPGAQSNRSRLGARERPRDGAPSRRGFRRSLRCSYSEQTAAPRSRQPARSQQGELGEREARAFSALSHQGKQMAVIVASE